MLPADGARAARSTISRTIFSGTGFGKNARQEYREATASITSISALRRIYDGAWPGQPPMPSRSRTLFAREYPRDFLDRPATEICGQHDQGPLRDIAR